MKQSVQDFRRAIVPDGTNTKSKGFRPDIQGLRAVAVLAVIADHLFEWPSGGFVGVDIFFVISGFLITGLLLKEHDRTGRISFGDFYRRRARRILPLAVLVLLGTIAASWFLLNAGRSKDITDDALWSALFSANWHFALIGTDYMNAGAAVSPLQHFWSLAVEEQFYVVWPWLLVLVLGLAGRSERWTAERSRRMLGILMTGFTAASFAWAMWETTANPTIAYFSTFSRAWELGIGALIAVFASSLSKISEPIRAGLAYLGLAGIAASLFVIDPTSAFPGPWAALPVLATGVVIAAGCGGSQKYLAPLTNRPARYVGDISYSLYLWHFPLIIIATELFQDKSMILNVILLAAVFILSSLSYHLLEDPVRRSSWLEPHASKRDKAPLQLSPLPYLACLLVVTMAVVGGALWQDNSRRSEIISAPAPALAATGTGEKEATAADQHVLKVQTALGAQSWPALSPAVEELGPSTKAPEWVEDGCLALEAGALADPIENAARCTYGNPKAAKTAVVLGDSVAISYVQGIRAALEPKGYKVLVYTLQQCPAARVAVLHGNEGNQPHPECDSFRDWTLTKVKELKPDLVVMSASRDTTDRLASGQKDTDALAEWTDGLRSTVAAIAGSANRIVLLDPPPGGKNLQECATKISSPADCTAGTDNHFQQMADANQDVAAAGAGKAKVEALSVEPWFCSFGKCPAFIGTTPVYADASHLTAKFSKSLAPVFSQALVG